MPLTQGSEARRAAARITGIRRTGPVSLGIMRMVTDSPTPVSRDTLLDALVHLVHPSKAHRRASADIRSERREKRRKTARVLPRRIDLENDHEYLVWQGKRRMVSRSLVALRAKGYIQPVRFNGEDSYELGETPFPWEVLSTGDEDDGRDAPATASG